MVITQNNTIFTQLETLVVFRFLPNLIIRHLNWTIIISLYSSIRFTLMCTHFRERCRLQWTRFHISEHHSNCQNTKTITPIFSKMLHTHRSRNNKWSCFRQSYNLVTRRARKLCPLKYKTIPILFYT